jgi:hypothetical protein
MNMKKRVIIFSAIALLAGFNLYLGLSDKSFEDISLIGVEANATGEDYTGWTFHNFHMEVSGRCLVCVMDGGTCDISSQGCF